VSKLCKISPIFAHIANFVACIMLIKFCLIVFGNKVCESATNQYGEMVFFDTIRRTVAVVSLIWCFGTIYGSLAHRHMPRDTSFYNPSLPRENVS